jgi:predicted cytidylate kinase
VKRPPHVTISGELGSGKSSVALRLAEVYSLRVVSTGDIQRSIAKSLNLSTLETNWLAERDKLIDSQVDQVTRDLGGAPDPIVFDSRMAWHMVPQSFKVHLVVDPMVAAKRLHTTRSSPTEQYESASHARELAEERYRSEQRRFLSTYGVDVFRLRNYNLVIDTSEADVDTVLQIVQQHIERDEAPTALPPRLYLHPRRIIPDQSTWPESRSSGSLEIGVGYSRPTFCSIGGHADVLDAVLRDDTLVEVTLVAEGTERVHENGHTAHDYVESLAHAPWVDLWREKYGLRCTSALR